MGTLKNCHMLLFCYGAESLFCYEPLGKLSLSRGFVPALFSSLSLHSSLIIKVGIVTYAVGVSPLLWIQREPVEDTQSILTGTAKQLIRHNAFLDEIVVQVAVEPVRTVLLREAIQVESASRKIPEVSSNRG